MRKALFLDRDGIINRDHGYVFQAADFDFMPGIFELAGRFTQAGYLLVVVTNQSGIGRGYYTEGQFLQLSEWMQARFAEQGVPLSGVYYCPHHPSSAQGDYLQACHCRKPEPGMLLQAAGELEIDLAASLMLGDKLSDVQAAQAAGVGRAVLLCQSPPATHAASPESGYSLIHDLAQLTP